MSGSGYNPDAIAAGKLPPGLSNHDRYSSFNGVAMTAVLGVFAFIATVSYCTRIYAKVFLVRRIGWDDLTCTLGYIGVLLDIVCFGVASIDGPLGKHMWNITLGDFLGNVFVYTGYIEQVTTSASLGFIKLTIFLFYLDIFWPLKWCRYAIWIGASLSSAFYLSMTIVQFYFMTPHPGETLAKHFGGKLAHKVTTLSIPTTAVGLVIDIVLLIIPLRAVIQLKINKKKKVRLVLTFFVGIMAVLGSVLSLIFKVKTYGDPDLTYHLTLVNFFVAVEMVFGICIASAPLISRAFGYHHAQLSSLTDSLQTPFLQFGRLFTTRSTTRVGTEREASNTYDVERNSDSNNRLVELRKLNYVKASSEESVQPVEALDDFRQKRK